MKYKPRLTQNEISDIRDLYLQKYSMRRLAKMFNRSISTIFLICTNRSYRNADFGAKIVDKIPLDINYILKLRKQKKTIEEIRVLEGNRMKRQKPYSNQSVRITLNKCLEKSKCQNKKHK